MLSLEHAIASKCNDELVHEADFISGLPVVIAAGWAAQQVRKHRDLQHQEDWPRAEQFSRKLQGRRQEHSGHLQLHQKIVTGFSTRNDNRNEDHYCCVEAQHRAAPCLTMLGLCYSQLELP